MPRLRTIADSDDAESEIERQRRLRREAQRQRRKDENSTEREDRRKKDTHARRLSRSALSAADDHQNRHSNSPWWERITILNTSQTAKPLGLLWNRNCKICGIKALTGERIHDRCFVCGPNGAHYQPLIPPYPKEWDCFIHNRKTAGISRKLNNIFSLTTSSKWEPARS
ncbi:hypothetical protein B0H14DRAFT_3139936, partial [Mycena olivaceomarginata]